MSVREDGFTLLELIVVILIIGILAAISIPSFLDQREQANRAAVQSDLRNIAIQAESYFVDNATFDGFEADPLFMDFRFSTGVTLTVDPARTTATSFCVDGTHVGLPEAWSYQNDRTPRLGDAAC